MQLGQDELTAEQFSAGAGLEPVVIVDAPEPVKMFYATDLIWIAVLGLGAFFLLKKAR